MQMKCEIRGRLRLNEDGGRTSMKCGVQKINNLNNIQLHIGRTSFLSQMSLYIVER